MKKEDIQLSDITRILFGDTPPVFFVEIIIRAVVIYVILVGGLRLMGKRMSSRLTRNELAAISTLAAAIGVPLQTPDKGLLPALIIGVIVVLVQRVVAHYGARNGSFERLTQGKISTLVEDARLLPAEMKKARISRERVFSQLRNSQIRHLGEVKRLYLEASGSFTLIRSPQARPGLCILPEWDKDFITEQAHVNDRHVCNHCGHEKTDQHTSSCPNCKQEEWVMPVR